MFETIITFIKSKSKSFWLRVTFLLLFISFLLYILLNYTFVEVNVVKNDAINQQVEIASIAEGRSAETVAQISNLVLTKRDSTGFTVSAGPDTTTKSIQKLPPIGIESVTINLFKDRDVDKYSGDNIGCSAFDSSKDTLLSYNCGSPKNVVTYENNISSDSPWENKLVATVSSDYSQVYSMEPFRDGVIGLRLTGFRIGDTSRNLLFYVDSEGQKQQYPIPDELETTQLGEVSIVTDNSSVNSNTLLLVGKFGDIYLGTIEADAIVYKKYTLPDEYNSQFDNLHCSLLTSTAYCYFGQGSESPDSPIATTYREKQDAGTVLKIDYASNQPTAESFTMAGDKANIDKIYISRFNKLYAQSDRELFEVTLESSQANRSLFNNEIASIGFGDALYYIKDNAVYRVNEEQRESYKVFASSNLTLSNLFIKGDSVFINAYIKDMPNSKLHTYLLSDRVHQNSNEKRLVDLLPFNTPPAIASIDYKDSTIRMRISTPVISDRQNNRTIYDEGQYLINKEFALKTLSERGITEQNYTIQTTR